MSSPKQQSVLPAQEQLDALLNDQWREEILPRLPETLEEQARELGAFVRRRHLCQASDLLRALLVYALGGLSFRGLGMWAVLTGVGSLSEKAWRKRLLNAAAWIKWVLATVIGTAQRPSWLPEELTGTGIVLLDCSCIKVIGGTGDDVRLHLGYDLLAGRMDHALVSDRHQAESIPAGMVQPNWIYVSDSGYRQGYVATVIKRGGQVVVRRHGHALHLEEEDGRVMDVRAQASRLGYGESHSLSGWINLPNKGQRAQVRVVLFHLPKEQAKQARGAKVTKAKAKGKKPQEAVLWWAEWVVLVTTLPEQDWSNALILQLYRARWQMHVLRLHQIERACLVVQLLLVGWALYEYEAQVMRELLQKIATPPTQATSGWVVSTWTLTAIGVLSLKQILWGGWSEQRWRACLPWLVRYLCLHCRKRGHQETEIRAQLLACTSPLRKKGRELTAA